jgi:hypothetical protein
VFEIQNVLQVGAPPFVDRLIRIAHDTQVPMMRGQSLNQQVLRAVGVLVFIDHHIAKLVAVVAADLFGLLEELHRLEQQVVEIERVGLLQRVHVQRIEFAELGVARIPGILRKRIGPFHPVLGMTDPGKHGSRLQRAVVKPQLPQRLLDHRQLIV